jgi:hypothetical protein
MAEITTGVIGLSPLHAELEKYGLDLSALALEEIKLLDGNPPETYDEWVRTCIVVWAATITIFWGLLHICLCLYMCISMFMEPFLFLFLSGSTCVPLDHVGGTTC